MELFSVVCITCRAKLKVRHASAIGQILPCPRCNGMVQITAPPGWTPPLRTVAPKAPDTPSDRGDAEPVATTSHEPPPAAAPIASEGEVVVRRAIYAVGAIAATAILGFGIWSTLREDDVPPEVVEAPSNAALPTPTPPAAQSSAASPSRSTSVPRSTPSPPAPPSATSATAPRPTVAARTALETPVAFRADQIPFAQAMNILAMQIGAPIELDEQSRELSMAAATWTFTLNEPRQPAGALLRTMLLRGDPQGDAVYQIRRRSDGSESILITTRRAVASRGESLLPEFATPAPATVVAATASPAPSGSVAPRPAATSATPQPTAITTPSSTALAGPQVLPAPPQPMPPPLAAPSATGDQPAVVPDAPPDLTLPQVAFDRTPLRLALTTLADTVGARVSYDWDTLATGELRLDRPITLSAARVTVSQAVAQVLAETGCTASVLGRQWRIVRPTDGRLIADRYDVAGLPGSGSSAADVAAMVRNFVAPESWVEAGGAASLDLDGNLLAVRQTAAVHRELKSFLARLSEARKPHAKGALSATRLARARPTLAKSVTMNFRPGVPLDTIAARLESTTGATITIDYPALAAAGYEGSEPTGCAASGHPLADVLSSICEPREWAWRVVDADVFDITTREALRRRPYVEFYEIPSPLPQGVGGGESLALQLQDALADEGWARSGGKGRIAYDAASQCLIVRHHQEAQSRIEPFLQRSGDDEPPKAVARPSSTARPTATKPGATP